MVEPQYYNWETTPKKYLSFTKFAIPFGIASQFGNVLYAGGFFLDVIIFLIDTLLSVIALVGICKRQWYGAKFLLFKYISGLIVNVSCIIYVANEVSPVYQDELLADYSGRAIALAIWFVLMYIYLKKRKPIFEPFASRISEALMKEMSTSGISVSNTPIVKPQYRKEEPYVVQQPKITSAKPVQTEFKKEEPFKVAESKSSPNSNASSLDHFISQNNIEVTETKKAIPEVSIEKTEPKPEPKKQVRPDSEYDRRITELERQLNELKAEREAELKANSKLKEDEEGQMYIDF